MLLRQAVEPGLPLSVQPLARPLEDAAEEARCGEAMIWDYMVLYMVGQDTSSRMAAFNELGRAGFELVAVEHEVAYFKRALDA